MSSEGVVLTAAQVRGYLAAGFHALEARKQEINDLNVYPVPDGDTGTNLALTVKTVVDSVNALPDETGGRELCGAISQAALMGARGNSGVILSQIIRGAMDVLGEQAKVEEAGLVRALRRAADTAYRAVRRPVEGTMLTVVREMAEAAERSEGEPDTGDGRGLVDGIVRAGWESVERTPTLLKVLADAGVVDAGGYGLAVLLEGAANGGKGFETPIATRIEPLPESLQFPDFEDEETSEYTYCTSFLLCGDSLDRGGLEDALAELGDSLLVVGGGTQVKVHVHSDDPGRVLGIATALGVLREIEIDNMKDQTAQREERLRGEGSGAAEKAGLTQLVAVVAGEGNKKLYRNLGVDFVVEGGQSMNPSAEDLARAVRRALAPSVVILPNNKNVIMTAEQTARLVDKEVFVASSRSIQAGLSAAVAFDRRVPGWENLVEMREALAGVASGEVTRAVRTSVVDGVQINEGDYIGLVEDQVKVAAPDLADVAEAVAGILLDGRREVLTILLGEGEDACQAREAAERLRSLHAEVEVEVHDGGQPYYPLLLAAE